MRLMISALCLLAVGCDTWTNCNGLPTILDGLLCYDVNGFDVDRLDLETRAEETRCAWLNRLPGRRDFSAELPGKITFYDREAMFDAGIYGEVWGDCATMSLIGNVWMSFELAIEHELVHFFDCRTNPSGDWYFTKKNFNHELPYFGIGSININAQKGGCLEYVN